MTMFNATLREEMTHMKIQQDEDWLSPSEVASMLGLGMTKTYSLLREELPSYRIGRIIRVDRRDVEGWLQDHRISPKD